MFPSMREHVLRVVHSLDVKGDSGPPRQLLFVQIFMETSPTFVVEVMQAGLQCRAMDGASHSRLRKVKGKIYRDIL